MGGKHPDGYYKERRRLKKLRGECSWCCQPALPGLAMCDRHRQVNNARTTVRQINSLEHQLKRNLRSRLRHAIKDGAKRGSAVRDLGCTTDELKLYLEARFQPGMTWENWSPTGWHIDHVKPLASFDLTDRKQFLAACHYTNLQPLWAEENLRKRASE